MSEEQSVPGLSREWTAEEREALIRCLFGDCFPEGEACDMGWCSCCPEGEL